MKKLFSLAIVCGSLMACNLSFADIKVPMYFTAAKGQGKAVGEIVLSQTPYGVLFTPHLTGLPAGLHGFHIHQNPSCDEMGKAAGDHLDPAHTGKHEGPYNDQGHLGDLPALFVDKDGAATHPVVAPRLKLADVMNHSLMIHAQGDNYSDQPEKLGGGGARMVCGVIK